ncbi:hypothetical protein ABI59_20510 [Acidobacteria bacterium Mor1]|nr:hypothetical protein ABI59_20510 [Acidobacteria bacterium Mor1]
MKTETLVNTAPLPALGLVAPPRAMRMVTYSLTALLIVLPILLIVTPWRQNIPAGGRVAAVDPLDRIQTLPAPVTGRVVEIFALEGAEVKKGDLLVEMADQDPQYASRLQQQIDLSAAKVEAAEQQIAAYEQQLINLEEARALAVAAAEADLRVAIEKVREKRQHLQAKEAELVQKKADLERRRRLFSRRLVSELDFQTAEAAHASAAASVEAARAAVEQALNEETSKRARVGQVDRDLRVKIESTRTLREEARSKSALAEKGRNEAVIAAERQKTQIVVAPRDGRVFRVRAAARADLLKQGDPLIDFVPDTEQLAVELWVRGNDAPLIDPGRKVRIQFEGWPAVQFSGWPSVAVGTFGGEVLIVDAQDDGTGRFRILVGPDPDSEPWPESRYLRQGARANGWVLLDEVRLGYELWRQLNGFPPSVETAPAAKGKA